jgi:hypothetical protein
MFLSTRFHTKKLHLFALVMIIFDIFFQGKVVALSLAVFMIYFFVLREENDIDLEMRGEGKKAEEIDQIFRNYLLESKR